MSKRNKYFNEINFNYLPMLVISALHQKSTKHMNTPSFKIIAKEFPILLIFTKLFVKSKTIEQSSYFTSSTYLVLVQESYQFSGYHFIFNCYHT